jgi:hypothetical protein
MPWIDTIPTAVLQYASETYTSHLIISNTCRRLRNLENKLIQVRMPGGIDTACCVHKPLLALHVAYASTIKAELGRTWPRV